MRSAPPSAPASRTAPDASMSLLRDITTEALDSGYGEATARRRAAGRPAGTMRGSPTLLVGVLLVGLLLATAAAQVRARASVSETTRAALVTEVRQRTAANDSLQRQVADLRSTTAAARDDVLALTTEGAAQAQRLRLLETVTGAAAVTGPGLVVTVDDAKGSGSALGAPRDRAQTDEGRVRDTDLQKVVNGLWAAGAEAVTVGGRRLTSLSAIRAAGEAILVSYRPLAPPYVIQAVGDPSALATAFAKSSGGVYLRLLGESYGIRSSVREDDSLDLPAASGISLRHATVGGTRS